jgi:hypothetical protein
MPDAQYHRCPEQQTHGAHQDQCDGVLQSQHGDGVHQEAPRREISRLQYREMPAARAHCRLHSGPGRTDGANLRVPGGSISAKRN